MPRKRTEINPIQGKRLKECIKKAGITQNKLAEKSYTTPQQISYIINGQRPMTNDSATLFAEVLGVRIEYLLGIDNFSTEREKKRQHFIEDCDKYDTFEYLLAQNGIGKEQCGSVETDHLLGYESLYDEEIGYVSNQLPVYQEMPIYRISFNEHEYILTEHQLSELQKEIEEYVKFRTLRMCEFFKEDNKKYYDDIWE